jgi:signal transduction histidine kinase
LASITPDHRVGDGDDSGTVFGKDARRRGAGSGVQLGILNLSRGRLALLILGTWTALGVFQAVPELLQAFNWNVFCAKLIDAWAWAVLTPAILVINKWLAPLERNIPLLGAVLLILSIVFSLIHLLITGLFLYALPGVWWNPLRTGTFGVYYFLGGWQTYCAIVGSLLAFKFYGRSLISQVALERAERRLLESHLNALRLQLEPHFLFNALNAISSEVDANAGLAREMIEDLAVLLRRSLDYRETAEITLAQEMTLLDHYLAIQKVRFGDRIEIEIDVEPEILPNLVPSLLLQPLVENAIRHGIEGRLSGGKIAVWARAADAVVEIRVLDDGVGLPPDWEVRAARGVGVRATHERLEALYPEVADPFAILPREGGGTEVTIRIPRHDTGRGFDDITVA